MKKIYGNYRHVDRGSCSTVIIGKNASATGRVILGHNEDDEECYVQAHLVPHLKHKEGEMIVFDDGKAVIPQVPETAAYFWTDVKCLGGISFADCFINEYGVAVATDSCRPSKDIYEGKADNREAYGLAYALRTLIAERATSARHGVEVAMELIEKFGYVSARTYHIADKNEAWALQVPKGFNAVARRIGDDEVYYMPNHFTIHEIDFDDHDNFIVSPGLVTHAIEAGWYTPAKEGDYSDFDFAAAYQFGENQYANVHRAQGAWYLLTGEMIPEEKIKRFSAKATRKYTIDDVKKVLRFHYEGMEMDHTEGGKLNPHRGYRTVNTICNNVTVESMIFDFADDPIDTKMYRALPKPCLSPFTPWYPLALAKIPHAYEHLNTVAAKGSHFDAGEDEMKYDPTKAWWIFKTVQWFTDLNYRFTHTLISERIAEIEKKWDAELPAIDKTYAALKETDPEAAKKFLADYTAAQAQNVLDHTLDLIDYMANRRIREDKYD
ncbi:MAG: C69 family dipeptidase [Solobacterium sp.]|nr:C69 family dipeptidase [Solobacterium sp.]